MSLINALKSYKQCDEDGIMCKVSRQAVDEAIERIAELEEALEKSLTDCQDCMAEQDQQIAELEKENEQLLIELDDISKQAAKELTGEAIQAKVKITMEAIDTEREGE